MVISLNFIRLLLLLSLPLIGVQGGCQCAWAQDELESVQPPQASTVKIGPHPIYTRILVNLTEPVLYQVKPDFANKQITLILPKTEKDPRLRGRSYNDKNLEQYSVRTFKEDLWITFSLKNPNTRLFHFLNPQKTQIILDLKSESRPILRTRIGKPE